MKTKTYFIIACALLISLLVVTQQACKKDDPKDPTPPVYTNGQGEIGSIGGTVKIDDPQSPINGASIVIPEGALSSTVEFTIVQPDSNYYINGSQDHLLIEILPSGIQFDKPVTIGIPYLTIENEEHFRAFYYDPENGILEELEPVELDKQNKIFYAETEHTSIYYDDEMEMNIHLVTIDDNGITRLASYVNILTDFEDLPTGWGYRWNGYPNALSILYSTYVPGVASNFIVDLRKKGSSSILATKEMDVWINQCSGGDENGQVVVDVITNGNHETIFSKNYVSKEVIADEYMSGEPLLFIFKDFEPNNDDKYYVKVSWGEEEDYRTFTDRYNLGKRRDAEKIGDMAYTIGDQDLNGILDNYEEGGGENQPPNPPTNPNPEPDATNVALNTTLSWSCTDPNGDDIDYDVYFGSENPPPYIGIKTSAYYNPGTLEPNTTYYWQILPFDDVSYMDSDLLQTWSFTTDAGSGSGPNPPSNIHAGNWYNIGVYWNDESNNEDGFKVYKATNQVNSGYSLLGEANANESFYPDASISGNNYYCYKVVSYNNDGETSSEFAVVPKSPTDIQASPDENDILIYWSDPYESQATRFYIYRKDGSNGEWESKAWVGAPNTSYQDYNVQSGVNYYYRVESTWGENSADALSRSLPSDEIGPFQVSGGGGTGTFTDPRDGQTYNIVTIGSQTWFAENLNYETTNSWWYDNSSTYGDVYGRLYTWEAALTACPSGWSLPSDDQWKQMEMALGMSQSEADDTGWRGTDEGGKMKETGTTHWNSPNTGATNTSGFTALPGGYRYSSGSFSNLGDYGYWWSSSESSGTYAWYRNLYYTDDQVFRYGSSKTRGFSVRCLKN